MPEGRLPKLTLSHDPKKEDWVLKDDNTDRTVRRFETKDQATQGGALAGALGKNGGSVKIKKLDGTYQEERTFPRTADPRGSKG